MSLVLEALRKQQAEHDPDTGAVTLALANAQHRRQRTWMILLTLALLLNAVLLGWLFLDRLTDRSPPERAAAAPPPVAPAMQAELQRAESAAPLTVAPGSAPGDTPLSNPQVLATTTTQALPAPAAASVPAALPPPRVLERIALDALPPAARARFPGIVLSTHVYAEDPALRAIVVNGERLQEGDQVDGLTIREINEFGLVVEFESYLVDVPVFTDW